MIKLALAVLAVAMLITGFDQNEPMYALIGGFLIGLQIGKMKV